MPSRRDVLAGFVGVAGTAGVSTPSRTAGWTASAPTRTWARTYAPADRERALVSDVVALEDGFALVGLAGGLDRYRGWVGGVDAAGRSRWHRFAGTGRSAFVDGVPAADGEGVVTAGVTNGTSDVLATDHGDPYAAQTAPDGTVSWARTYQPDRPDGRANAVARMASGYVVAGSGTVVGSGTDATEERPWAASIDANGTRTWAWDGDEAGDVNDAVGVSGGAFVGGSTWQPNADVPAPRGRQEDAWVARLTAGGSVAWRWRGEREGGDRIEAVAPHPDGGVVALGRRGFATDDRGVGWLVALDGGGSRLWERTYPQATWNWLDGLVALDGGDGGYVLAGTREEAKTDARGAWLLRIDADGRVVWDYQAATGTRGFTVHALADGGLLVGGERSVGSQRGNAAWLAKLGGEPSEAEGQGPDLPSMPSWAGAFLAGSALGALGAKAVTAWRRSESEA